MEKCVLVIIFWALFISCQPEQIEAPFILLESSTTGIDFENTITQTDSANIIQYLYFNNGAGVGAGDFNNDGHPDVFFAANQQSPQLYLNNAQGRLSFTNVSEATGLSKIEGWSTGVSLVDINADGLLDVYLCQLGNYKSFSGTNRLLINKGVDENGIPQFEDQASEYGVSYSGLSTQAAFFDYDIDGDLDMYLLNHSVHRTSNYGNADLRREFNDQYGDRLYENKNGHFHNVTKEANIFGSRLGYGLGIAISDIDQNSYPDIYIANDFHEHDYLYLNQGDGRFEEVIEVSMGHTSQFSMGVDIADINEDRMPDIMSLDMRPEDPQVKMTTISHDPNTIFNFKHSLGYHFQYPHNQLQIQQGTDESGIPRFSEIASAINVDATDWSWSVLLEDFNNDGRKDIFISNGIVQRPNDLDYLNFIADDQVQQNASDLQLIEKMPAGLANNYFYFQDDEYEFSKFQLIQDIGISNGAAYADFDLDGDLDLITNNINQRALVYENTSTNHYVQLELKGSEKNRLAIGAKIELISQSQHFIRELHLARGFMSSVDHIMTIGLGDKTLIDTLIIEWPDGQRQLLENIESDQRLVLSKSEGVPYTPHRLLEQALFEKVSDHSIVLQHVENESHSPRADYTALKQYNRQGPALAVDDINGDGRIDLFFGNAFGSPSSVLNSIQLETYVSVDTMAWIEDKNYEDVCATFADLDGDADLDIIVGSHGVGLAPSLIRYYINDGQLSFAKKTDPIQISNPSVLAVCDFDQDGDEDYFVGSGSPGDSNPLNIHSTNSNIMVNDGQGHFKAFNEELTDLGQVTDAGWVDIDNDGDQDLLVAAEWRPLTILVNTENGFSKQEIKNSEGLWQCLEITDIDQDGDMDIIAGNIGLNNFIKASDEEPVVLSKIDGSPNAQLQTVIQFAGNNHLSSIEEIIKQFPQLKKNLTSHKDMSSWLMSDSFASQVQTLGKATEFQSMIFYNQGNAQFRKHPLAIEAQISTVNSILAEDLNGDDLIDLIIGGNEMQFTSSFGNKDASYGLVLLQKEDNSFQVMTSIESGLLIDGVIRDIKPIGRGQFLFALNDQAAVIYSITQ